MVGRKGDRRGSRDVIIVVSAVLRPLLNLSLLELRFLVHIHDKMSICKAFRMSNVLINLPRRTLPCARSVSSLTRTFQQNVCKNSLSANSIRTTNQGGAYEGDGKTTVNILNAKDQELILVNTYSNSGFRINTGLFFVGPVAIFPRTVFQWDVNSIHDINEESLSLFWLVEPKVDILIIGVGDRGLELDGNVRLFLSKKKITCEALATAEAIATFNFLNNDNRNVAAALIPPTTVGLDYDERFIMQQHKRTLFKDSGESEREMEALYEDMGRDIDHARKLLQDDVEKQKREQEKRMDKEKY